MRFSPLFFTLAASAVTFGIGQMLLPTAHALPAAPPDYRVSIKNLHIKHLLGSLEITGQVVNTGRQTLTYTSVVTIFTDTAGLEVGRGYGYLTTGPLRPGEESGFRSSAPDPSHFTHMQMTFREAGRVVEVEKPHQTSGVIGSTRAL